MIVVENVKPVNLKEESNMTREVISSSSIKSAGYDKDKRTLEIEFNSGAVYVYSDVGEDVFTSMKAADSAGRFFNQNIKNSYEFVKV